MNSYPNNLNTHKLINSVKILSKKYLCGPNLWNYRPSMEVLIDIGEFENYPSNKIPFFYENLKKTLPTMMNDRCSDGNFFQRVKDGTYFGHILEHVTLQLQNYMNMEGGTGRTRETEKSGVYKIVVSSLSDNMNVIEECFNCALDLLYQIVQNKKADLKIYMRRIMSLSHQWYGINTYEIIKSTKPSIPYFKIDDSNNFIQFGYGKNQKRIWTSETCYTSGISETISKNKLFTKKLLMEQGIHVPEGGIAYNMNDVYEIVKKIDYPVTIKPSNANGARGVSLNIQNIDDLSNAFKHAEKWNKGDMKGVIVEKYIQGDTYRITLVNYKVVGCAKNLFKYFQDILVGDGISSISELIDDLFSKRILENYYKEISLDDEVVTEHVHFYYSDYTTEYLEKNGYTMDSILPFNSKFVLERKYDAYIQCLDDLNEKTKEKCCLSAKIVGIDICGIDIILKNIKKPFTKNNGSILELNAGAGLALHKNAKNPIGLEIIDYLFQNDLSNENVSTIPIIHICGGNEYNVGFINNFISSFFIFLGKYVGSFGNNGFCINNSLIKNTNESEPTWKSVKKVLMNKRIEMAVFDTNTQIIDSEGIFYRYCNSIVLGEIKEPPQDCKSECMIEEIENVFKLLRVNVDIVPKNGFAILNKDDENIEKLVELCDGSIIFYTNKNTLENKNNSNQYISNVNVGEFDERFFENNRTETKYSEKKRKDSYLNYRTVSYENNSVFIYENYQKKRLLIVDDVVVQKINFNNITIFLAAIGGIWSYYDLFNETNLKTFQHFINFKM